MRPTLPITDMPASPTLRPSRYTYLVLSVAAALLALAIVLDVGLGEPRVQRMIAPKTVIRVLARHIPVVGRHVPVTADILGNNAEVIVWQLRLPEVMAATIIGMLLALSGVAFQSLLQNPLADPYTIGVASG